jgi:hypothetical protein
VYCEDRTYDLVTGGSNGAVYLWRGGVVAATCQAFRGKVRCLVVSGDRVYCGGGGGGLRVLDARTLTQLQTFTLLPVEAPLKSAGGAGGSRGGTSSGGAPGAMRPRPASAGPAARRAGRTVEIKSRAPLAAPKQHAAGGVSNPNRESAGAAIAGAGMRGAAVSQDDLDAEMMRDDGSGEKAVIGLTVVRGTGRVAAQSTYLIAALGTGKVVRVDIGSPIGGGGGGGGSGYTPRPGSAGMGRPGTAGANGTGE